MRALIAINAYRRNRPRQSKGKQLSVEENKDVEPEAQAAVPATETEQVQAEAPEESLQEKRRRNDAEYNWAEARKKMQELERQNKEMQEEVKSLKKGSQPVQEEEDFGIKDDDIAEGKHVKELKKELKTLKSYIQQKEASTVDDRLSLKHPDFVEIVTKENIELLKQNEPELAMSLYHIPDPFQQGVAAYKMIKKLGIGVEVVKSPEKEKAQKNAAKPVSVNAVSKQSAIGNAHLFENGLTSELKSQLYKEMQEAAKRA